MSLLIKNGRVVTAADDYVGDVFIDGETIHSVGKNLPAKADRIIDASGSESKKSPRKSVGCRN